MDAKRKIKKQNITRCTGSTRYILLKISFYAFCCLFGLLLLLLLILLLILAIDAVKLKHSVEDPENNFARKGDNYVAIKPNMIHQPFPVEKQENEFRVFILGGSAAMGTPYVHQAQNINSVFAFLFNIRSEGGIATWMQEYLQETYPKKKITVVNAAKASTDLSSNVDTLKEIIEIGSPDLVVIMSGNNEHYKYPSDGRFREYISKEDGEGENFKTALGNITLEFNRSVQAIISLTKTNTQAIPVYFLTVPTILRDWKPFEHKEFDYETVERMIQNKEYSSAKDFLELNYLDDNSIKWFYLARIYDEQKDYDTAREYYILAKDLDKEFLRTRSDWNELIRNIDQTNPGTSNIKVIDMEKILFNYSEDGIPGFDIFHDHVHLIYQYNQIAALEINKHVLPDFFSKDDIKKMNAVELEEFLPNYLRKLYLIKLIKALRFKYFNYYLTFLDKAEDDGRNIDLVIDNYKQDLEHIKNASEMIDSEASKNY